MHVCVGLPPLLELEYVQSFPSHVHISITIKSWDAGIQVIAVKTLIYMLEKKLQGLM